jgi:predicted GNAT family acetyltransferase
MIREAKLTDLDFIYDSWIRSVKCPTKAVADMTRCLIDDVIDSKNVRIYCDDDDHDHILGWIAYGQIEETPLLHFLFVKKNLRGNGIGYKLLSHVYPERKRNRNSPVFCSFWSFHMQKMNARGKWHTRFVSNLLPACIFNILTTEDSRREYHEELPEGVSYG